MLCWRPSCIKTELVRRKKTKELETTENTAHPDHSAGFKCHKMASDHFTLTILCTAQLCQLLLHYLHAVRRFLQVFHQHVSMVVFCVFVFLTAKNTSMLTSTQMPLHINHFCWHVLYLGRSWLSSHQQSIPKVIILNHSLSTFAELRQAFLRLRSGPSDSGFPMELATVLETDLIVSEALTAFPGTVGKNEQYFNESYRCPSSNQNGGTKRTEKKGTWSSVHTIESETRLQLQSNFWQRRLFVLIIKCALHGLGCGERCSPA